MGDVQLMVRHISFKLSASSSEFSPHPLQTVGTRLYILFMRLLE